MITINVFWFRRDLRLEDNTALKVALKAGLPVLPIFIFDENILNDLDKNDARVQFIHQQLSNIDLTLKNAGSSLLCKKGEPLHIWKLLLSEYHINAVYTNEDYEPYAIRRDKLIKALLQENNISFQLFKDQVVFEKDEIVKDDGKPYTIYTPYKNIWLAKFSSQNLQDAQKPDVTKFYQFYANFPSLSEIGFLPNAIQVKPINPDALLHYQDKRDYPSMETSNTSVHLRFGTISIRQPVKSLQETDAVYLSELIWREFFMQILFHFPYVVSGAFRKEYDHILWLNQESDYEAWCKGKTGYPLVDAGMNELNATGYMHNRVRMVTASFLCKHLLIDWRWGEAYFASKLLDYDLSANNGNWQWAAGTGCDAAPYFRIFNPSSQQEKFDKHFEYIKKWNPDFQKKMPIINHDFARKRALATYKAGLAIKQ